MLHGRAFAALRLGGEIGQRARRRLPRGEKSVFALTAALLVLLLFSVGTGLPMDRATSSSQLPWLVPSLWLITPALLAAQLGSWWVFRHKVHAASYL